MSYTIKQIANGLNINPETVRRWIREGRLNAVCNSKREGNIIEEIDLLRFLDKNPKYSWDVLRDEASTDVLESYRKAMRYDIELLDDKIATLMEKRQLLIEKLKGLG